MQIYIYIYIHFISFTHLFSRLYLDSRNSDNAGICACASE